MTGSRPKTFQPRVRPATGDGAVVAGGARPVTGGGRPVTGGGAPGIHDQGTPAGGVPVATSRRQGRRAPYVAPVRVVAGPRHFDGRVENISEGGMMVSLPPGLAERESVSVRFALPMTRTLVSVPSTVVWQEPGRTGGVLVGLEFALIDETLRREVARYVELCAPPETG